MTGIEIRGDFAIEKMTEREKQDLTFKAVQELKEAIRATTNGYMKTGALLSMIFDKKLYRNYSSDVRTWNEFVAQTCPFGVAFADHTRRVYNKFKDHIGDRQIPFNRLLEALPIVTDENIENIVEDAECLPRKAWEDTLAEKKGRMPSDVCLHEKTELWERCIRAACGRFLRKIGIEEKPKCKWVFNDKDYTWKSGCNKTFVFDSGIPSENSFKFCPFCGHILEEVVADG